VQVKDAAAQSASKNFSINVVSPVPTVANHSARQRRTVSGTISVSGTASDSVSISSVQVAVDGWELLERFRHQTTGPSPNTAFLFPTVRIPFPRKPPMPQAYPLPSSPLPVTVKQRHDRLRLHPLCFTLRK